MHCPEYPTGAKQSLLTSNRHPNGQGLLLAVFSFVVLAHLPKNQSVIRNHRPCDCRSTMLLTKVHD